MYKIGNFSFDIYNIKNKQMLISLNDFLCYHQSAYFYYQINYVNHFNSDFHSITYKNKNFIVEKINGGYRYSYFYKNIIYAMIEEKQNYSLIYLHKEIINQDVHPYFLPSLLLLERRLIDKDSFCLHSSSISYHNQAILFTAPSGGGKSTQADLWMKYKCAVILNGDRNIVGKEKKNWLVYGTPFSGSSSYRLNQTLQVKVIIILEKGSINNITKADTNAFQKIFSQVTVCPWDREYCDKIIDIIIHACQEIPIYIYSCTKDESAVTFLYDTLIKDGVINE